MTDREIDRATRTAPGSPTPGPAAERARSAVVEALEACDVARAAWEAGSAAFGRADRSSDLDIAVLCSPGGGTAVLDSIERALREHVDDLVAYDVGRSLFGVQRFWRVPIGQLPAPTCMVDASVMELEADADLWRELLSPERHGRALGIYDPDQLLASCIARAGLDLDAHRKRIRAELHKVADRRAMFADFPAKELARGRSLDAHAMFDAMVATPLVSLLGVYHRPLRFDFGQRYLHAELPADVVERLAPIIRPAVDDLDSATAAGLAWIDELLDAIDVDAIPLQQHAEQMRTAFG